MKKRQYAPLWKNIGIAVQMILTVIFVVSVCLLSALIHKKVLDSRDVSNANFVDSGCYSDLFREKTDELINFLKLRSKFETNGEYDPKKIVNTLRYAKDGTILEDTGNSHIYIVSQDSEGNYEYSERYTGDLFSEEGENVQEKAQVRLSNYTIGDLINWSKKGYTKTNGKLDEEYRSITGDSIAESLDAELITQVQADNLYSALEATLSTIGQEGSAYKKGLNEFQVDETNLTYSYGENGRQLYSNMDRQEDYLGYARSQGSYLYYDGINLKFRTNIGEMEEYFYSTLDGALSNLGSQAEFMVAVNTNFSYPDDFSKARAEYATLHPWVIISIIALVVSLFGWIISLVYLTTAAGRSEEDEGTHLNIFDRIKTEIFFASFVVVVVLLIGMTLSVSQSSWGIPGMLVMAGVGAFIYDGVFLLFYLSMVRRIKAGVLWEHSLLLWFVKGIRRVMSTWKSSVRILVLYGMGIFLLLLLAYGSFAMNSVLAIAGLLLLVCGEGIIYLRDVVGQQEIMKGIEKITDGDLSYKLPLDNLHSDNRELAQAVNSIGDGLRHAVNESTKNERMKADLITNVSHDIKTPLTSIINYVNLLKMEPIENERIREYIHILDEKSQRLKQLTEDLVEASRISSGNITLQMTKINLVELIYQTGGEFNEKFEAKDLTTITKLPKDAAYIMADGRRIWRVVENLYNNVAKYAMAHTRVYVTMEKNEDEVKFSIKNISEQLIAVDSSELTERFIRGEEARSTEGSGLGLSIAQNLTMLMGGQFDIQLDGDVFTAAFTFPLVKESEQKPID